MQIPAWVDSDHRAVVCRYFSRSPQSPCRETCALLKSPVCSLSFNYSLFDLRHSAMNSCWYLSSGLLLSCHFPSAFFIHSQIPVLHFPCFHLSPGSLSSSPPSLHPSASLLHSFPPIFVPQLGVFVGLSHKNIRCIILHVNWIIAFRCTMKAGRKEG